MPLPVQVHTDVPLQIVARESGWRSLKRAPFYFSLSKSKYYRISEAESIYISVGRLQLQCFWIMDLIGDDIGLDTGGKTGRFS